MSRSFSYGRIGELLNVPRAERAPQRLEGWRLGQVASPRTRRFDGLELLEGRALLDTVNARAVISSTPAGADFNSAALTNSSSSSSGIGTFWFSWVPGEDFMANAPISVTPPAGWTDNVTNERAGDGFAIQFVAYSAANDVQQASTLNFSFESADSLAALGGNSV
jgi:hypothetical protein